MILHKRIALELLYGVHIYIHTAVGTYDLRTLLYVTYASLTQYVKLLVPKLLSRLHVPLRCGEPFRSHVKCRITAYRLFGDENTPGMYVS